MRGDFKIISKSYYDVMLCKKNLKRSPVLILTIFLFAALLFIALLLFAPFSIASTEDNLRQQIDDKQKIIQDLEKQIDQYEKAINSSANQENSLHNQINALNKKISSALLKIKLTQTEIGQTNLQINSLEQQLNQKEKDLIKNKQYLAGVISATFKLESEPLIITLIKNKTVSGIFDNLIASQQLQSKTLEKIQQITILKKYMAETQQQLDDKKTDLNNYSSKLKYQNEELSGTKQEKNSLLKETQNQEKKYQQLLKETQNQQEIIQREIYSLEQKLRSLINPAYLPPAGSHILSWPVEGSMRITQKYGPTYITGFINDAYNFHNGIDIGALEGTYVKAADDGIVIAQGDSKYAYGKWMAIKHDNGLTTLYGHLSSASASTGQKVNKGDIIGRVGKTGFATGPHLHFTVYSSNTFSVSSRWFGLLPLGGSLNPLYYL